MESVAGTHVVGDDLFGRERELTQIWQKLERGAHLLMTAPGRVGKTSLMMELHHDPRNGWIVAYANVEACTAPDEIIAEIIAALAEKEEFKQKFLDETIGCIKKTAGWVGSFLIGIFRAEIRPAMKNNWKREADRFQKRLQLFIPDDRKVLIIIDELPTPINNMLKSENQKREAETFMSWLRELRQDQKLRNKVHTLVSGSIGMEGVMRRMRKSSLINDMTTYHLSSWSKETAAKFLRKLSDRAECKLTDLAIEEMLTLLQDPIPYHVHLYFEMLQTEFASNNGSMPAGLVERCFKEQLASFQGVAHLGHYRKNLELIFETQEKRRIAQQILRAASAQRNGIKVSELGSNSYQEQQETQSIIAELIAEKFLVVENGNLKFCSNLLRFWWKKHEVGVWE